MRHFPLDRPNLPQTAFVVLATVGSLALLGFVLAYWTWAWLAPRPEPRMPAAAEQVGGISAAALFGEVQRDGNTALQAGASIRLLGIVAATPGRRGYALVQLEAAEMLAVLEGDDVAPGIRLAEVGVDHVILERGAIRETLAWPDRNVAPESPVLPSRQ